MHQNARLYEAVVAKTVILTVQLETRTVEGDFLRAKCFEIQNERATLSWFLVLFHK